MNTPKVSIVIPAHNEEAFIADTLRAVTSLTYPDFEIIVVDNNSTDKTGEVVRAFPNVVLVEEKNKGTQFAREAGRRVATGEIIANIDADCLPDPEWLTRGAKFFENEKVVALSGPYDYFDGSWALRNITLVSQEVIYTTGNWLCRILKIGGTLIGGNCIFRASALQKMGGYNTAITFYGDDTDTAKRIARLGKVIFTKQVRMKTSARRFKNEGVWTILGTYLFYFFKIIFSKAK